MTTFRAMTWNVENLFRPPAGANQTDQQEYQRKLALLAGVIDRLDPDVVALQEVGGEEPLHDLQQALGGTYPQRTVSAFPDHRGIRVAFLSKHAVEEQADIVDFPPGPALDVHDLSATGGSIPVTRMGRGALRIRVVKDGLTVNLVTAHLKSKLLTFPGGFSPKGEDERARFVVYALNRRAAEAATIRAYTTNLLAGDGQHRALIVAGDLNDEPQAATTQLLHGPPGSEIGTGGFDQPDQGDGQRLWNLALLIPEDQRFSRVYRGRGELIDHLLVSHVLVKAVQTVTTGEIEIPSITDQPSERQDQAGSDHRRWWHGLSLAE